MFENGITTGKTRVPGCENNYTVDQLYDTFGMDEKETKICMKCPNHRMEGGIITCKHLLEGLDD